MTAYNHARCIIEQNRQAVEMMAQTLLEEESLEAEEIQALLDRAGAITH
jgi:ATP-dependent Zn protease